MRYVFEVAGLPPVQVWVWRQYLMNELRVRLRARLEIVASSVVAQGTVADDKPYCPKCGSPIMLRTAKRVENTGEQFRGCTNYPRCKHTLSYEA